MKPIFSANHRWAMARGEESLKLEMARCASTARSEQALIPDPPEPTTMPSPTLVLGAATAFVLVAGVGYWLIRQGNRPRSA